MTHAPVASILAEWAADLPSPNSKLSDCRANNAFIDTLACIFAGSQDKATLSVLEATSKIHGKGNQTVFGQDVKLPPAGAALVNGMAAHALDFDDNFLPGFTHASAVLVPTLIVIGEMQEHSGQRLRDAYVIGLELQARVSLLVNPEHYGAGWHSTSTVGVIGAAGAAAVMMGLSPERICSAMSIAFSLAAGSKLQFGTSTKPLHAGLAAQNSVLAACMAASGIGAQPGFLTGRWSFQELYSQGKKVNYSAALEGLGTHWAIEEHGLLTKRFPCCAASHLALDAIEILREKLGADTSDLHKVTARLPARLYDNLRFDRPETENEARFSFTYPAACLLRDGHLSLSHFTPEAIQDTDRTTHLAMFQRERVDTGSDDTSTSVQLLAEFKSGRKEEIVANDPIGGSKKPLSENDLQRKVSDCLAWSGLENKRSVIDQFSNLKNIQSLGCS
ncbi:MmgE/PrpD family protein [Sneathiella sp.]|uniref:MmgE/PrpD family protein n=1 Tax=Sneathiella sp. TaxID=1964365 RepID=UPI0026397FD7|nr:MmgE/PrpD family protein [Sneathiella sp.]MDF2368430.1 MmgE/PrpD family protein [Sneathiella sp.]